MRKSVYIGAIAVGTVPLAIVAPQAGADTTPPVVVASGTAHFPASDGAQPIFTQTGTTSCATTTLDPISSASFRIRIPAACVDGFLEGGTGYGTSDETAVLSSPVDITIGSVDRPVTMPPDVTTDEYFRSLYFPSTDGTGELHEFNAASYPCAYVTVGVAAVGASAYDAGAGGLNCNATGAYEFPADHLFGGSTMAGFASDPVEAAYGNFTDSVDDIFSTDGVYGIGFTRSYNSLDATAGVLGTGWRGSYSATLATQINGDVDLQLDDGRVVTFALVGSDFAQPLEFAGKLVSNGDGTYRVEMPDGETWQFDTNGQLASKADGMGQTVTISHDSSGNVGTVTSSTGPSLTMAYTSGLLSSVTASDGRAVGYAYTGGALTSVTDTATHATTIAVDGNNRITQITDPTGVVTVANTYDTDGRVATQTTPTGTSTFAYDPANYLTTVTTSPGAEVVTYHFDQYGRLLWIEDPLGHSASRTYDTASGFLTSGIDRVGLESDATFDSDGNQLTSTDPAAGTITYTYDADNRVTSVDDPQSGTTTFGYDGSERLPSTIIDALSHTTTQDVVGDLVMSTTDADGVTTTMTYNAQHQMLTSADASGHTTTYTYDAAGRMTSETMPSGATKSWTYDGAGRVLTETAEDGGVTTPTYDAAGRTATVMDPTGAVTAFAYNAQGLQSSMTPPGKPATTYAYDDLGQMTSTTEPGGATTLFAYGELGRLTSTTDPLGRVTSYAYDAAGRQTTETAPDGGETTNGFDGTRGLQTSVTAPGSRITTTAYNADGSVDHVTDPTGASTSYAYDSVGRQISETDPTGVVTTTAYTPGGRVASTTSPATGIVTNTYNSDGRLTKTTNALSGDTVYAYDADGHTTSVTTPAGLTTATSYFATGLPHVLTAPDSSTVTKTYSLRGEVLTQQQSGRGTVTYTYNPDRTVATVQNAIGGTTTFGYDDRGNKVSQTDPAGGVTMWGYDLANQMTSMTLPQVTGQPLAATTYAYDPNGRLATVTDPTGRVTTNTWNQAGDLLSDSFAGGGAAAVSHAYTYDNAGRRLTATGTDGTSGWTYDAAGRPTSITEPGSRISSYTYDTAGRLKTETSPAGFGVAYTYDALGRPTAIAPTSRLADTFTAPNGTVVDSKSWTSAVTSYAIGAVQDNGFRVNTAPVNGSAYSITSKEAVNTSEDLRFDYTFNDKTTPNRMKLKAWNRASTAGNYMIDVSSDSSTATVFRNSTQLGSMTIPNATTVGVRFRVTGSTIGLRMWDASGTEPSTWGVSTTDTGVTAPGYSKIQVAQSTGANQITIDNISETDPAAALPPIDTIGYDADGRVTTETLPGGSRTWGYTNGRLTSLNESIPSLTRNTTLGYTSGAISSETTGGVTTTYGYDNAGELTSATPSSGSATTYTYANSGRRLTQKIGTITTTYGYDNAGELTSATPSTGTATTYGYDLAGRRTGETTGTTATTYGYDAASRLTGQMRNAAGTITSDTRTFLPNGLLATSVSAGVTHSYDWDPSQQLLDWQHADSTTQLTNSPAGWADMTQGPTIGALGLDAYGSVLTSTTASTAVARSNAYTAYGTPSGTNTFDARLGYRGELTLDTLTNLRARDYQSSGGVFLSRDPLVDVQGTPTTANSYHYGNNDPLNQTDPSGKRPADSAFTSPFCHGDSAEELVCGPVGASTASPAIEQVSAITSGNVNRGCVGADQHTEVATMPTVYGDTVQLSCGNSSFGVRHIVKKHFGQEFTLNGMLVITGTLNEGSRIPNKKDPHDPDGEVGIRRGKPSWLYSHRFISQKCYLDGQACEPPRPFTVDVVTWTGEMDHQYVKTAYVANVPRSTEGGYLVGLYVASIPAYTSVGSVGYAF